MKLGIRRKASQDPNHRYLSLTLETDVKNISNSGVMILSATWTRNVLLKH